MKVFLSHQSSSKPFVRQRANELAIAGIESWVDDAEIGPGESLVKRISEGIHEECDALIAFVGRAALESSWVREELNEGKFAEITKPNFQVIVVLLDNIDPNDPELPPYLRGKKHVLWEQEAPENPDEEHPAIGRIIRQLYKSSRPVSSDEAARDANTVLDRFLTFLYVIGGQREVAKRISEGPPRVYGEVRQELSLTARAMLLKYSAAPAAPPSSVVRDTVAAVLHAEIALKDWAEGYDNVDFQESVVGDFRRVLRRTAAALALREIADRIHKRIDLHSSPDMRGLYRITRLSSKSPLFWMTDLTSQYWRLGMTELKDPERDAKTLQPFLGKVLANPYQGWVAVGWPYPL